MQINVQGVTDEAQAAEVEQALASALHSADVEFSEVKPSGDEASKAIDPVTAAFIIKLLGTKTTVMVAKALLLAIPTIYSDLKNRRVVIDVHGFKFGYDDLQNNKLQDLKRFVESWGEKQNVAKTRHALLVAVGFSAKDNKIPRLRFVENDVQQLKAVLNSNDQGLAFEVATLVNPKHSELREAIHQLLSERVPTEEVIIYYSGHGFKSSEGTFLCCNDTERAKLALNGFRTDDLGVFIRESQASQILVLLDCCYGGGAADDVLTNRLFEKVADRSLHLITAASDRQAAKESGAKEMGVFTHYLIEGIVSGAGANANQEITASSLHQYIAQKIAENERGVQSPKYNVKNKDREFLFKRTTGTLADAFNKVREFVLELNAKGLISLNEVGKVLKNCFGAADYPKSWEAKFIDNVRGYKDGRVTFDQFRKIQGIEPGLVSSEQQRTKLIVSILVALLVAIVLFFWMQAGGEPD
jgi:Caspase domain